MIDDEGGVAALEELKEIIRGNIPADKVDAHAMRLLGESEDAIDGEARDLFEALQRHPHPFSRTEAFGLVCALCAVIRDRIREIEGNAS